MCCKTPCQVIRCNGCPRTDWSAFTWQWTSPGANGFLQEAGSAIKRQFAANDVAMTYPGACPCTWIVDGGDIGTDTVGTYQDIDTSYPIPSIGALQYRRVGYQFVWQLTLARWYYNWAWTNLDTRYYGLGWGWSPTWGDEACENGWGNPYWGGYGGYGYNGWGWGYGGIAGYGYYYGQYGSTHTVTYSLQSGSVMSCTGDTTRFYLDPQLDNEDFDAAHWPAYIDIARVQK